MLLLRDGSFAGARLGVTAVAKGLLNVVLSTESFLNWAKTISLSRGGPARPGYWYSVSLSGFSPGAQVIVYCNDSVDRNFWTQTIAIGGAGRGGASTLCYSADGPDHWVTSNVTGAQRVPRADLR